MSTKKNLIIVTRNAKEYKTQILFEHFDNVENNFSDDRSLELVYVGWDFGDRDYDNSKIIPDYNLL
jgi:hypothetical protein